MTTLGIYFTIFPDIHLVADSIEGRKHEPLLFHHYY